MITPRYSTIKYNTIKFIRFPEIIGLNLWLCCYQQHYNVFNLTLFVTFSTNKLLFVFLCRVFFHFFLNPVNKWIHPGVVSIPILLCTSFSPANKTNGDPCPSFVLPSFCFSNKSSPTISFTGVTLSLSISGTKCYCQVDWKRARSTQLVTLNFEKIWKKKSWKKKSFLSGFSPNFKALVTPHPVAMPCLLRIAKSPSSFSGKHTVRTNGLSSSGRVELQESYVIQEATIVFVMNKYLLYPHFLFWILLPSQIMDARFNDVAKTN